MSPASFPAESNRRSIELLAISSALVTAPHMFNLPVPIMGFFALMVVWRLAAARGLLPLPGRWFLMLLTAAGAALVFAEFHKFYGKEAGASLLSVSLGLKLMELRAARDAYLAVFLAFFVAVTQYLFSQSIPMALYTLAIVVLLFTTLISLNSDAEFAQRQQLRLAGIMVLQAIPLMLLLFVLFPRIPGPLWKLPDDEPRATSGLSEVIEPGSIGKLGLSQELAFRVQFEGKPPPPRLRYWRGPVFWHTDGRRWTLSPEETRESRSSLVMAGPAMPYTVILEPTQQRWVYALDLPSEFPNELKQTPEFLLIARDKILDRRQYRLVSHTEYGTGPLSERERTLGLQLPEKMEAKLLELVSGWKRSAPASKDMVERALAYFRQEPFYYTLNPPLTSGDPVASFLFQTRRGFCEHYATAFVVLMRLSSIPARVVTGYQGGLWNGVGRFIEVRQADAHAWVEVWLEEKGWVRIDPTAAVAPERIEYGLDIDTQVAAGEIRFNPLEAKFAGDALAFAELIKQARLVWNSIDYSWNLWVLSYDPQNQDRLLRALGILDWQKLAWWLAGSSSLMVSVLALLILPVRGRKPDPAQRIYGHFLRKLARHGFEKGPAEGASSFCRRISPALPAQAEQIQSITALYQGLRYGKPGHPDRLRTFQQLIRKLSL